MLLKKISQIRILKRLLVERLSEPFHINLFSLFIYLFGTFKQKVFFDLIIRQHNAYCILKAAEDAKAMGLKGIRIIEFGVATGAGLMNMSKIAKKVSKITAIDIDVIGFDSGEGLTPPDGYKDYSDRFQLGDYEMDTDTLKKNLDTNTTLILGDVKDTIPNFLKDANHDKPIAYIVLDLDLYTSSKYALHILTGKPSLYMPTLYLYLDDIDEFRHSTFCGEELAVKEFNQKNTLRKIEPFHFLKTLRLCKNPKWIQKIFKVHIFDHDIFSKSLPNKKKTIVNPYLT